MDQEKLTDDQVLLENAIAATGSAKNLSKRSGLNVSTISRYRKGKQPIRDRKVRCLLELATENGILRLENARLKRLKRI